MEDWPTVIVALMICISWCQATHGPRSPRVWPVFEAAQDDVAKQDG